MESGSGYRRSQIAALTFAIAASGLGSLAQHMGLRAPMSIPNMPRLSGGRARHRDKPAFNRAKVNRRRKLALMSKRRNR